MEKTTRAQGTFKSALLVVFLAIFSFILNILEFMVGVGGDGMGMGLFINVFFRFLAIFFLLLCLFAGRLKKLTTVFIFITNIIIIIQALFKILGTIGMSIGSYDNLYQLFYSMYALLLAVAIIAYAIKSMQIRLHPGKSTTILFLLGIFIISYYAMQFAYTLITRRLVLDDSSFLSALANFIFYSLVLMIITPFRKVNLLRKQMINDPFLPKLCNHDCRLKNGFILGLSIASLVVFAALTIFIATPFVLDVWLMLIPVAAISIVHMLFFFKKNIDQRKKITLFASILMAIIIGIPGFMVLANARAGIPDDPNAFYVLGGSIYWFLTPLLLPLVYLIKTNRIKEEKLNTIYLSIMLGLSIVVGFFQYYFHFEPINAPLMTHVIVSLLATFSVVLPIITYFLIILSTTFKQKNETIDLEE